ncbi:MAG TPA: YdcF family protein [Aliidongia sp.]|uniref:YdcF family protein n=1 Tax=Aliidongia sp. TaxID=1914230 RepID=UPI002DDD6A1F|nr:YdcF family protein [Aliidongia sp.]HEV2674585.1 YdcF family protein [Aliidongia sp.]
MFFLIAKLYGFVASPSHFALILLIVGALLLFTRFYRAVRWLFLLLGLVGLFVLPGGVQRLAQPLENRFPAQPTLCRIDGIILLGGGEATKLSVQRRQPILDQRAGKYFAALELLRRFPEAKLIIAAGNGSLDPGGTHETDVAAGLFAQAGVDPSRLLFDPDSRDTFENFENAKKMVSPKPDERWVLLTGAIHMPRSVAIARQVGFPVIPWPTDYHTRPDGLLFTQNFGHSLALLDDVFHEWIGLAVYRLTGRSNALLPDVTPVDGGCAPGTPS